MQTLTRRHFGLLLAGTGAGLATLAGRPGDRFPAAWADVK